MLDRLETICRSTAAKWECEVLEFNGEVDHVHLLLALTPKVLPSAFVNNLKTVTSRLLRKVARSEWTKIIKQKQT